ncbi:pH-sensitive chloride channel 2-like [Ischnura elegans]|uniref:pH-sensitive chloride channel 2-like n=1 Tax=Ischnura elegans TaxID=197161 RepID=UPI001ED8A858|nr:pH-sensitive chloride channel 2-like [Ischnura elegans]XP_046385254.1 pH-sensitive chloride channel 2-like [Ischnura elegans]XP_046385255.1 pH-sensitive chloride channel 2-like [Ischnura elegans]
MSFASGCARVPPRRLPLHLLPFIALLLLLPGACIAADNSSCPDDLNSLGHLSDMQFILHLTDPCRYDKLVRPFSATTVNDTKSRVSNVTARVYVFFLGSIEAQSLQFTAHLLLQLQWYDPRLSFQNIHGPVVGESALKDRLWIPHLYLSNERDSFVMGGGDLKDVLISIQPDGMVLYSSRIKVDLFCLMDLQKFPFDQQECPLSFESWTYDTDELLLFWEPNSPVTLNENLHLTEYNLDDMWVNNSFVSYALPGKSSPTEAMSAPFGNRTGDGGRFFAHDTDGDAKSYRGKFVGNYSTLVIHFHLSRQIGHYIMDYYLPSILLVGLSWIAFWLDPNAVPGRVTLGSSTLLTFITLTRNTGTALPKVSYVKATEIWFMVCTGLIFGSLIEFAFVNTIWRRRKNVELKKVNSKYILRSTLTPKMHRKYNGMKGSSPTGSGELDRSWTSVADLSELKRRSYFNREGLHKGNSGNMLSVQSMESLGRNNAEGDIFPSTMTVDSSLCTVPMEGHDKGADCVSVTIPVPNKEGEAASKSFTTMTPQEIATWIDKRSRVFFPAIFLIFNILYWGFVWI